MTDAWIGGYKYFYNVTLPFDAFEPYSTIVSLALGIPTFALATYTYAILLSHPNFRGKAYFHIFIAQGIIDLFAFLTNLLRYRLPLFQLFGPFYASLGDGVWATTLCAIAISMPRAQVVAQCLLSANRVLAVRRPFDYDMWQATFSRCGILLLIVVPILVAIPDVLNGFFVFALYGVRGTVIFASTAKRGEMMKVADGLATGFQFSLTIFAFLCNCALIVIVATKKGAMKTAGTGLVITTVAQFVTHLAYALIMVCYLYFPPPLRNASMFTTIALDAISILPIWMLLAFSKYVREAVLERIPRRKGKATSMVADIATITVLPMAS